MTRKEAMKILDTTPIIGEETDRIEIAIEMAIEVLSREPSEDVISRNAAIDTIMGQSPETHYPSWYAEQIKALPSTEPEIILCKDCIWHNEDTNQCTR